MTVLEVCLMLLAISLASCCCVFETSVVYLTKLWKGLNSAWSSLC